MKKNRHNIKSGSSVERSDERIKETQEVFTPPELVESMIDDIDVELLKDSLVNVPLMKDLFYRSEYRNRWNQFESEEIKWIDSALVVISEIVHEKQAKLFLNYYPNTNKISSSDERHKKWLRYIVHLKENHKLELDDPYPFFIQNAPKRSMVWSLTDKHPNCEAHNLMANQVFKAVFADDQLKP